MSKQQKNQEVQAQNDLQIIKPQRVRLSKDGKTLIVFVSDKVVYMFSRKFVDAVFNREYKKKETA